MPGYMVQIVPLRIGGGSRLKILEALSTGVPVVSTTVGAEGLRLRPGEHVTVADSADAFAMAVIEAIRRPEAAWAQAARGRTRVLAEYDWAGLAERLGTVWEGAARKAEPAKRRDRPPGAHIPRAPIPDTDPAAVR